MDSDNYRLWWRCLALSRRANWTDAVEEAFGDGWGLPFEQWWAMCKHLFSKPEKLLLREIDSAAEFDRWRLGDGSDVVVLVNLLSPKNELLKAFEQLLDELHAGARGRPAFDDWADWKMTGPVNVLAVEKALDVWEFAQANPGMSNWMIGQRLRINPARSDGEPNAYDRKVLNAQVSRYKAQAERLVRGVERGVFPAR